VAACSKRLEADVREHTAGGAPIIALGNTATGAIFGTKVTITNFRTGPAKESPLYPGVKVVPTLHPAYVLRQTDSFKLFNDDIGKANVSVNVRWEAPVFRVFDQESDARGALQELFRRSGDVVHDIECGSEKDEDFVHPDQYKLLCTGLCYAPGRAIVIGETALSYPGVQRMLADLLESRDGRGRRNGRGRNTAHNGKFDFAGFKRYTTRAALGFDTMLASYAVDESRGTHGLKYLAQERLGAPPYDLELKKYKTKTGFQNVPREILYKYNAYDVVGTWGLKDLYEATMTPDEWGIHDMLVSATETMMWAEMHGLNLDMEYVNKVDEEMQETLDFREYKLRRWVDNPRSWMQVGAALDALGVRVKDTRKETLEIALRRITQEEPRVFIKRLLAYRKVHKQHSTYVRGMLKRVYQGRVHPTFLMHGTTTGRFACRNPNLYNIPRASSMRRMFVPSPGKVFVQGDYKGAELRVLACESGDEYLHTLLNDPTRDLNNEVALKWFGPGFTKDQRVRAKAVIYGVGYGREPYSIAQEFGIPLAEAQAYHDSFLGLIPKARQWQEDTRNKVLHGEDDLVTHFGRHRRILLVTDDNQKDILNECLAFVPQSTVADLTLLSAVELHEKYGLDFRLHVYDSVLVETDPGDAREVGQLMKEVMERKAKEVYSDFVPFDVDIATGNSWGEL
jgi:DNA polymerase-1